MSLLREKAYMTRAGGGIPPRSRQTDQGVMR